MASRITKKELRHAQKLVTTQIWIYALLLVLPVVIFFAVLQPFTRQGDLFYLELPRWAAYIDIIYWVEWVVVALLVGCLVLEYKAFKAFYKRPFEPKGVFTRSSPERQVLNAGVIQATVAAACLLEAYFLTIKGLMFPHLVELLNGRVTIPYSDYYPFFMLMTLFTLSETFLLLGGVLVKVRDRITVKRTGSTPRGGTQAIAPEAGRDEPGGEMRYLTIRERKEIKIKEIRRKQEEKIRKRQEEILAKHEQKERVKRKSRAQRKLEKAQRKKMALMTKLEKEEFERAFGLEKGEGDDDEEIVRDEYDFT
ncbi:MAG: hypothetical protein ACTSU5_17535 [Promethearchaeota archaeon]